MTWLVLDMDEGLLRKEPSRGAAVLWASNHLGGNVYGRHAYGPGVYEYWIGMARDDCDTVSIVRSDKAVDQGWQAALDAGAKFPYPDDPLLERR